MRSVALCMVMRLGASVNSSAEHDKGRADMMQNQIHDTECQHWEKNSHSVRVRLLHALLTSGPVTRSSASAAVLAFRKLITKRKTR
jgi:hypothetical protein